MLHNFTIFYHCFALVLHGLSLDVLPILYLYPVVADTFGACTPSLNGPAGLPTKWCRT